MTYGIDTFQDSLCTRTLTSSTLSMHPLAKACRSQKPSDHSLQVRHSRWKQCFCLIPAPTVPTTAGAGSETTGTAILDITSMSFKTGIANRAMKRTLGIVDTINTRSCSRELHIIAGLDVLFHSLESYTAIPYARSARSPQLPS